MGNIDQTRVIVEYLTRDRGEEPNARLYSALILANVSPEQGSVDQVSRILREMEAQDVELDSGICHNVLRVLSIHLDRLLRCDILDLMAQRWYTVSAEGRQHVTAALLREGDLELGLESLAEIRADGPDSLPVWLVEMAIDLLLQAGEIRCALELVTHHRPASLHNALSAAVYHTLLDESSTRHDLGCTLWVWESQVIPGHLDPAAGVCLNVLATAAQHGKSELATGAFKRLGTLGHVFSTRDYERLYQAYLTAQQPNLEAALGVFSIMAGNKLNPTAACMRPLYTFLSRRPDLMQPALQHAVQMHQDGLGLPLAVLNTMLEVHSTNGDLDQAMEVYKTMPGFETQTGSNDPRMPFADAVTFEHIYAAMGRTKAPDPKALGELAQSICEDQQAMCIPLTSTMRERLALIPDGSGLLEKVKEMLGTGSTDTRLS